MYRLAALLIGYAFGCLQNGYFLSRRVADIDIRDYGSGGAGMTNVTRVLGFRWGVIVLLADMAKAVLAILLVTLLFRCRCGDCYIHPGLYAGLGVVLGHDFPFYLKFKGGKGVASTLGLLLMLDWKIALIVYAVTFLIAFFIKYISVASLTMSVIIPVLFAAFGYDWEVITVTGFLCVLSWYMHRGNIKRLIKGEETKFGFRGTKKEKPTSSLPPYDPGEPLPFPPNEGKSPEIEVNGDIYIRIPVRTHVITHEDTMESAFARYLTPHLREGDITFFSEKAVACTQNRAIKMSDIKPRKLAVYLSKKVHKSPLGIGLGIPETMEMALRECGTPRILFAAFVSVIGKLFKRTGWFYYVAGPKARGIDGPCAYTLPPYNDYVVLTPLKPDISARTISEKIGVPAIIVDSNDKGCHVLGASDFKMDKKLYSRVLLDNPMGQSSEQTPCGIIRKR
jgi:acyl-phosphate glycerol 3-phosphate acyltransferase